MIRSILSIFLLSLFSFLLGEAEAQQAGDVKVSSYAPVKDLDQQLDYYLERIGRDLSDEDAYEEDQQERVALDASTVAVLALSLGMHDAEIPTPKPASRIAGLASELADTADDFEAARDIHEKLKAAAKAKATGDSISWEPVAELYLLMKQVPIVNNALRRGVTSRRFARSIDATAGHAVTLAAIAQASFIDTSYCGDEADEKEWQRICADMRDAAAEVYKALREKDQNQAKVGMEKIVKTCDDCHFKFRD